MLSVQTRSTTWTIQYGIGASPTSFTTLGSTYSDPASFGTTTRSFTTGDLVGINNQTSVWFRVVALTASSGTGSRDTFGIDNFSLTFSGGAADVSIGGTNTFSSSSLGGTAFTSADTALLDGTAATVNLSGAVTAAGLKFVTTGYNLASPTGSDTIAVTGAIDVATGASGTLSAKLTGANALSKTGTGNLTLSNATNDFVGNISLGAGTLEITSDGALGNTANDIALGGGTLKTASSIALNAGRDLTGSGSLAIASGQTLTVNGNLTGSALTFAESGTLALAGSTNSASSLAFTAPGAVSGTALTLNGGITTGAYSGNASVSNNLDFGTAADRALVVEGNLQLAGNTILGASRRLVKTGNGTLTLSGDQAGNLGGIRLGVQGATPVEGGSLIVSANNALGNTTFQFNSGTLSSSGERTFANALSIGGRGNGVSAPTLSGSNATFNGSGNGFFRATGTSGELRLDVNNTTTVTGNWTAASGSGTATGITIGGTGSLVLGGNASALTETVTLANSVTLQVRNALGGGVSAGTGTTLGGNGTIAGSVALNGATIGSSGDTLTLSSNLTTTGASDVAASSTVNVTGTTTVSSGNLTINGNLGVSGSIAGAGSVIISSTGRLTGNTTIASAAKLSGGSFGTSGNTLNLGSTLDVSGTNTIATGVTVNVTGNTTITSGVFSVNGNLGGDGAKIIGNTATLKGNGTISGPTTIQAGGTLAPGNSPGVQTFTGDLTLAGTTELEINGSDRGDTYDGINLTGTSANTLTYGGTLSMSFNAPITIGVYDLFAIGSVTQASAFGTVTIGGTAIDSSTGAITDNGWTASITEIASGPTWNLIFNNATGDLTITAIPEPSAYAALAGFGMIGVALYRRRSQNAAKRAT